MNMMKLRQILEMRRANKAPPLIPPKPKRASDAERSKRGPKEIIDVRVNLRLGFKYYFTHPNLETSTQGKSPSQTLSL
jgi:hypothetical protein